MTCPQSREPPAVESVLTTCPFCPCGCALYLQSREGRPVGVAPSQNHPVSQGRLCARGWNAHEAVAWGQRLTRPLVRRGDTLEPASWEAALELARTSLTGLLEGGKGVGVIGSARATNEENYLACRLARGALQTGNLDSALRATYQPIVTGIASVGGRSRGTLADVEASGCILVLEGDLAATHPQAMRAVIRAVKAGATLVTIGCARTQLARLASLHVPVLPGERAVAVAGLLAAALGAPTAPAAARELPGFSALEASLAGIGATEQARLAAGWLLQAERAGILIAPEGGPPARLELEGAAVATLAALTGHLERPGSALLPLPARANLRGACEMGVAPDLLPGEAALDDAAAAERLARAWGRRPAQAAGLAAEAMPSAVSGLVVVADDLLAGSTNGPQALGQLECLIAIDAFVTPMARAAHIVLPIASFAENEGTTTGMDGRIQRVRPIAPPPGEARPAWEVLAELSASLGLPHAFCSVGDVLREVGGVVPAYDGVVDGVRAEAWGTFASVDGERRGIGLRPLTSQRLVVALPEVLGLDGVFDWGADPLVGFSPTLCRDHVASRKLYPRGLVQMSKRDAERLALRQGWTVRLASPHGDATVPVVLRDELEPGVLLVPVAFREHVAGVLGGRTEAAVTVQKAG
jgi:predicted molibdopterin-dependent oxidoreductase YjgC